MLDMIWPYLPQFAAGLKLTLLVSLGSFLIAMLVAILAVPLIMSGPKLVRMFLGGYVQIVRGVPELLVIFMVFYGGTVVLSTISGSYFEVDALSAGIAALAAVAFAYLLEILRAALISIPAGQREAGQVLGLKRHQVFSRIIFPQMLMRALPGIGNQWLISLKESALVSVVGLEELMRHSVIAAGATREPMVFYLLAALIYVAITGISTFLLRQAELRLSSGKQS